MEGKTYISKTLVHNGATITVRRPVLDADELAKRQQKITDNLSHALADYLNRRK